MRLLLALLCCLCANILLAQRTILHCGQLVDVKSGTVLKEMSIIVEGNTISAVQTGYVPGAATDKLIALKNRTATPGPIDMHVHLESETNPNRYMETFTFNPADYAFQSVVFSERTLMIGFTTVRDLGGSGVNISLRNAINKGLIKGPRVYTSG